MQLQNRQLWGYLSEVQANIAAFTRGPDLAFRIPLVDFECGSAGGDGDSLALRVAFRQGPCHRGYRPLLAFDIHREC